MAPKKKTLGKGKLEVERIVSDKFLGGKRFFFVKWKDFSSRDNTWEPEENLPKCSRHIREYFHGKGLRNSKSHTLSSTLQRSIIVSKQRRSSIDSLIAATTSLKSSHRLEPSDVRGSGKETKPSGSGRRRKFAAKSVLDADGPLVKLVRIDYLVNLTQQKDQSDAKSIADMANSEHASEAASVPSVELTKIVSFEMNDTRCNDLCNLNNQYKCSDFAVAFPRIPSMSVDSMEVNGEDTPTLVSFAGDIDAKKLAEISAENICPLKTFEVAAASPIQLAKIVGFGRNNAMRIDQTSVNDQRMYSKLNVASSRVPSPISAKSLKVEVGDTSVIVSSAADIDAEKPEEVSLPNSVLLETSEVAPASPIELAKIVALNAKYNRYVDESNMINRSKCSDLVVSLPKICPSGLVGSTEVEDTVAMVPSTAVVNATNPAEISQNLCLIPETFEAAAVPSVDEFPLEDTQNKSSVLQQQKCKALTVTLPKIIAVASVRSIRVATDDTATTVSSVADINLQNLVERSQQNSYQLETFEAAPVSSVDSANIPKPEDDTRQSNRHSTCSDQAVAWLPKISPPAIVDSSQIEVDGIASSSIYESNLYVDKEQTCSLGADTPMNSESVPSRCVFSMNFKPNATGIIVRPLNQSPLPKVLTPAPILDEIEDSDEELLTARPFAGDSGKENASWMGKKSHRGKKTPARRN